MHRLLLRLALLACVVPALPCRVSAADKPHWAFVPPRRPAVPAVQNDALVRTPVDRFIQKALEARRLTLGQAADRATLIRRVSYDLTGLPPTPADIKFFLNDKSPDAYEQMV